MKEFSLFTFFYLSILDSPCTNKKLLLLIFSNPLFIIFMFFSSH